MKKITCRLIGKIPLIGKILQSKFDFFAFSCSPLIDDLSKSNNYKLILEWIKTNPDQVISPKKVNELLNERRFIK